MLRFISKLNDDLKDQLFILCSATSRYLTTIAAQLMLGNVVPNSFVTPEGRMSRLGGWPNQIIRYVIHSFKLFRQKFDNRCANQNLSAAACRIYRRRRHTGGGAHVCFMILIYRSPRSLSNYGSSARPKELHLTTYATFLSQLS